MLLHFLFSFLTALVTLTSATITKVTKPTSLISQELHDRTFPPLAPGSHYSWKYLFSPNERLPIKVWVRIMQQLEHISLWNLGLTCKWFGAVLRDNNLKVTNVWRSRVRFSQLLIYSHLNFHKRHLEFIRPWMIAKFPSAGAPGEQPSVANRRHAIDLYNRIYPRVGSPSVLEFVFSIWPHYYQEEMMRIELWMHVWVVPRATGPKLLFLGAGKHLYLPNPSRLFDLVNWKSVLSFQLASTHGSRLDKSHMFTFAIVTDYLVPYCLLNVEPPKAHLKAVRAMAPYIQQDTDPSYFSHLIWAMKYATEDMSIPQMGAALKNIHTTFVHFGLDLKKLAAKNETNMSNKNNMANMEAVYLIAKQWGLSIQAIAKNTSSWCPLSREILAEPLPNFLQLEEITARDIAMILFKGEQFERLTRDYDGNFITEEEFERQLKRQREEQMGLHEEPALKKQKTDQETMEIDDAFLSNFFETETPTNVQTNVLTNIQTIVQPGFDPGVQNLSQHAELHRQQVARQQAAYINALQFQAEYIRQITISQLNLS